MKLWNAVKHVQEGFPVRFKADDCDYIISEVREFTEYDLCSMEDGWQVHQETKELTWQEIEEAINSYKGTDVVDFQAVNENTSTIQTRERILLGKVKQKLGFK
jgi:hypothetical protein